MNIEEYRLYCLSKPGVVESIPFSRLPDVLVFKVMGKIFTATSISAFSGFSIKCVPETIDELRATFSALEKPSYFSKKHWCSVALDGTVSDEILYEWLDISYELVVRKLTRKERHTLSNS